MKAQSSSLPFTPVFAALIAIINTKLPQVGELVLVRLVSQFRRAFKRNDKVGGRLASPLLRAVGHAVGWLIDSPTCPLSFPTSLL